MDSKSIMGYANNSPYRNSPYLDIKTPEGLITMENTDIDLLGIDNLGNVKKMKAKSKNPYKFPGTTVREIPMQQGGEPFAPVTVSSGEYAINMYKKPVQPVIYQKPQQTKFNPNIQWQGNSQNYNVYLKQKADLEKQGYTLGHSEKNWQEYIDPNNPGHSLGLFIPEKPAPKPKRRTSSAQLIPDEMEDMNLSVQGRTSPNVDVNKVITTPFFRTYRRDDGSQGTQYYPTYESFLEGTKGLPYVNQQVAGDKSSAKLTGYKKGGNPFQVGGSMNDLFSYLFEDDEAPKQEAPTAPSTDELDQREEQLSLREKQLKEQEDYDEAMQVVNQPFDDMPLTQRFKRAFGTPGVNPAVVNSQNELMSRYNLGNLGIWGDESHQRRRSDHNTGDAQDFSFQSPDDANGAISELMRDADKRKVKYIIYNGRIWNPSISPDWRPYDGTNPHTDHFHVSYNR